MVFAMICEGGIQYIMKFVDVSNKILQYFLFISGLLALLFLPILSIFLFWLPATTATISTFIIASIFSEKGIDTVCIIFAVFLIFLLFMSGIAIRKKNSLTAFICFVFYICDMIFAIVRMRNYWLKFDSFNDKTLLAAIADPLVLILFVIYFVGIFKEKKVAKKQIAVSVSDK